MTEKQIGLRFFDDTRHITAEALDACLARNRQVLFDAQNGRGDYDESLGWLDITCHAGRDTLAALEQLAHEIQARSRHFVLIGVGGSNQAARAAIKALGNPSGVEILYAGNTLSARSVQSLVDNLAGKTFTANVIAKNFATLEPGIAFRVIRGLLEKQHGSDAGRHIVATGTEGELLEQLSRAHGYTFLPFPRDVGGRYSVFSNVGLLPMAVAGLDIRRLVEGGAAMQARLMQTGFADNIAFRYACLRSLLYRQKYSLELLAIFEPSLRYFGKWWQQLFAESEGKDARGLYVAGVEYTEDLHSVGQFVQDGSRSLFETFLDIKDAGKNEISPLPDAVSDGFNYLDGMNFAAINRIAFEATLEAHSGVLPCLVWDVPQLDEYYLGQLFYLFEFACYVSGMLLEVNPFDQPGVEDYKTRMFARLGRK